MDQVRRRGGMSWIGGVCFLAVLAATPSSSRSEDPPRYRDANQPVAARVDDLLARMTLEEKVAQLSSIWDAKPALLDEQKRLDSAKLAERYPHGIGQLARPSDI